jgi:hypothetical protein
MYVNAGTKEGPRKPNRSQQQNYVRSCVVRRFPSSFCSTLRSKLARSSLQVWRGMLSPFAFTASLCFGTNRTTITERCMLVSSMDLFAYYELMPYHQQYIRLGM